MNSFAADYLQCYKGRIIGYDRDNFFKTTRNSDVPFVEFGFNLVSVTPKHCKSVAALIKEFKRNK